MALVLGLCVFGFGILFLRLHTLPERVAHKGHKIQFEIVAILGLLALFTHMHIFWVIGLLLAFIDFPDFGGFLGRIASSVERMAGLKPSARATDVMPTGSTMTLCPPETSSDPYESVEPNAGKKPIRAVPSRKGLDHV
jgi:hypothetical protein